MSAHKKPVHKNHKETEHKKRKRKFLWLFLGLFSLFLIVFTFYPDTVEAIVGSFRSFKPGVKTATLPADIQKAAATEAVKELTQGYDYQHEDAAALVDSQDQVAAQSNILPDSPLYLLKKLGRRIREFLTFNPLAKTQLILKNNSLETVETLALLQKASKDSNPITRGWKMNIVEGEISAIENRFNTILSLSEKVAKTDKEKAKAINAVAFNYAEKYFRSELILKGLQEKLSDTDFTKIETARTKGLTAFTKVLLNYHPDPQILSRELTNTLSFETGTYYKDIKTAEILQEIEDVTKEESQKTSLRLAQYILIEQFEKKMLAQPTAKRREILDTLVSKLPGNPMQEFKTMSRIRRVFTSHELIAYTELYKAKILEHFENRVLGLSTEVLQSQFVKSWIKDPADLRILEALELRINGNKNADPKLIELVKGLKTLAYKEIKDVYGQDPETLKGTLFYESSTRTPDVLDIKVTVDLNKTLDNSTTVKDIKKEVVTKFVENLPSNHANISVSASPETTSLLQDLTSFIPQGSLNNVSATITAETELDNIEVPKTNTEIYNLVNKLEQSPEIALVTETLPTHIDITISQPDTRISQPSIEETVDRTEKLVEEVLSVPAGVETPVKESLPQVVQQEIEQVQGNSNPAPQVDQTVIRTTINTVEQTQTNTQVNPQQTQEVSTPSVQESAPSVPESPPPANVTVPAL